MRSLHVNFLSGIAALALVLPATLSATTTYNYLGNVFASASAPYSLSDFVSLSVSFNTPLAPNLTIAQQLTAASFSISDGVNSITNATAVDNTFRFVTDGSGQILQWFIEVDGPGSVVIFTKDNPDVADGGRNPTGAGNILADPGTWTVTPEPSTSSLTILGLLIGLGGRKWRSLRVRT